MKHDVGEAPLVCEPLQVLEGVLEDTSVAVFIGFVAGLRVEERDDGFVGAVFDGGSVGVAQGLGPRLPPEALCLEG